MGEFFWDGAQVSHTTWYNLIQKRPELTQTYHLEKLRLNNDQTYLEKNKNLYEFQGTVWNIQALFALPK